MGVTLDIMDAFVRCRYKAFLKCTGQAGSPTEYELLERRLADAYQEKAIQRLAERFSPREVALGPLSLEDALKGRHRLILNVSSMDEHGSITIPAIERLASGRQQDYAVLTFSPGNKVTRHHEAPCRFAGNGSQAMARPAGFVCEGRFRPRFSTTRLGLSGPNGPTHLGKEATSTLLRSRNDGHDASGSQAVPQRPLRRL